MNRGCSKKSLTFKNPINLDRQVPKPNMNSSIVYNTYYQKNNVDSENQNLKNIDAINGNFTGDLAANDINLIGDVVATNSHITNDLCIDENLTTNKIHVLGDAVVDKNFVACNILTNNMIVEHDLKTDAITTAIIKSYSNIDIVTGIGHHVRIPNIKYNIDISDKPLICIDRIKTAKIFVVSRNVILKADPSCDGIEIIVFNKKKQGEIVVRDFDKIIANLDAQSTIKLIYLSLVNKWINT